MGIARWDHDDDWESQCDSCGLHGNDDSSVYDLEADLELAGWEISRYAAFDGVTFADATCPDCSSSPAGSELIEAGATITADGVEVHSTPVFTLAHLDGSYPWHLVPREEK